MILIAKCALLGAKDNDKVRSNAVRALGNFTRFASNLLFTEEDNTLELFDSIIKTLIENTHEGSAKVRWNACYALGNLFRNDSILEFSGSSVRTAMETLLSLLSTASNFKIRINACVALSSPPSLDYYGGELERLWAVVDKCLASLDSLEDVASFQYKDSLYEQLIRVSVHLVELHARAGKMVAISNRATHLVEIWSVFWRKFQSPFFRRPKTVGEDGPSAQTATLSSAVLIESLKTLKTHSSLDKAVEDRIAALVDELSNGPTTAPFPGEQPSQSSE